MAVMQIIAIIKINYKILSLSWWLLASASKNPAENFYDNRFSSAEWTMKINKYIGRFAFDVFDIFAENIGDDAGIDL